MFDVTDLRSTIVPKSDQLNAEQLLTGSITITVTDVRIGSDDQPVIINYQGDSGRPYKPSKTQRKLLLFSWGQDGRDWVGRSMTIFCDPKIKFGGEEVGGIRISHLSDIAREIQISLTATKGKKVQHTIKVLKAAPEVKAPTLSQVLFEIDAASTLDALSIVGELASRLADKDKGSAKAAYKSRMITLKKQADLPAVDAGEFTAT